jgi:hypothetical protein
VSRVFVDLGRLIQQGRVKCLCGRPATGTTLGGEPECAELACHAAEEIERLHNRLAEIERVAGSDDA